MLGGSGSPERTRRLLTQLASPLAAYSQSEMAVIRSPARRRDAGSTRAASSSGVALVATSRRLPPRGISASQVTPSAATRLIASSP